MGENREKRDLFFDDGGQRNTVQALVVFSIVVAVLGIALFFFWQLAALLAGLAITLAVLVWSFHDQLMKAEKMLKAYWPLVKFAVFCVLVVPVSVLGLIGIFAIAYGLSDSRVWQLALILVQVAAMALGLRWFYRRAIFKTEKGGWTMLRALVAVVVFGSLVSVFNADHSVVGAFVSRATKAVDFYNLAELAACFTAIKLLIRFKDRSRLVSLRGD